MPGVGHNPSLGELLWRNSSKPLKQRISRLAFLKVIREVRGKRGANTAIRANVDDWCPVPHRWPVPGPPPPLLAIASDLSYIANTFQAGSLREAILDVASLVLQRADIAVG